MLSKEASEFVEPKRAINAGGWGGYQHGCFMREGYGCCGVCRGTGVLVVKSFEVLLQLEGGIELCID